MKLPPLSLLAFPLSPPLRIHCQQRRCPTMIYTQSQRQEYQAIVEQRVTANTNANTTKKRNPKRQQKKKRSSPQYNRLTAREKSISLGNDPIMSLNLNLDHLAKSTHNPASAVRAEEMLLRIEALHADGYYEKPPDVVSYNCVINAYAHGRGLRDTRLENGVRLARRMRDRGITPNEITYNTLLMCILKELEETHSSNTKMRSEKVAQAERILSTMETMNLCDTRSYNTMISILSKWNGKDAHVRAEGCLRRMMERYNSTGDERIEPDVCSFNSVIHAYANAIDSRYPNNSNKRYPSNNNNALYAQKAEYLLKEMETLFRSGTMGSVEPDVVSYSAVINAYARAASKENEWCADRAMQICDELEENYLAAIKADKKGIAEPNKKVYSAVCYPFINCKTPFFDTFCSDGTSFAINLYRCHIFLRSLMHSQELAMQKKPMKSSTR